MTTTDRHFCVKSAVTALLLGLMASIPLHAQTAGDARQILQRVEENQRG